MPGAAVVEQVLAADPGTLGRADSLRAKPFADAKEVVKLPAGAKVDIVSRNGGWYQVKSGTRAGWVRMLSVRRATAPAGSNIAGLASVASGRAGTGTVSTTTGIRGLDSAELATASFNEVQVAKAETYRTSRADADAFARTGKLTQAIARERGELLRGAQHFLGLRLLQPGLDRGDPALRHERRDRIGGEAEGLLQQAVEHTPELAAIPAGRTVTLPDVIKAPWGDGNTGALMLWAFKTGTYSSTVPQGGQPRNMVVRSRSSPTAVRGCFFSAKLGLNPSLSQSIATFPALTR